MNLPFLIQTAGALQLVIAFANFFAPAKLHYAENLAKVSPIIRQIFLVHSAYIVLILTGFGVMCLLFPQDFCTLHGLGAFLCRFLALFWTVRIGLQFFYYDLAIKRENPWGTFAFGFAFVFLASSFIVVTLFAK